MRTLTTLIFALLVAAALGWAQPARADCPDGMEELNCGGLPVCKPSGSSCCGAVACASDLVCLSCGDAQVCTAPGSSCCGNVACPPDQECVTCGTATSCRRRGEDCPVGGLD
jgi:hypothetical protein